eukprot:264560_1
MDIDAEYACIHFGNFKNFTKKNIGRTHAQFNPSRMSIEDLDVYGHNAIIIDNGSHTIKAGFECADTPRCTLQSIIGTPRHKGIMVGMRMKDFWFGDEAVHKRGILSLNYPIQQGIITDWDKIEILWNHIFYNELDIQPEEHPILMTESPVNSTANREKMTEIMFETFNIPKYYIAVQEELAMYASDNQTGIVIHSGDAATHIVPIVKMKAVKNAIQSLDFGGKILTDYMQSILIERGYSFTTNSEWEIVKDIKEKLGYVAVDFDDEYQRSQISSEIEANYELECVITIGNERFRCCEPLFQPSLLDALDQYTCSQRMGIHKLLHTSVLKCREDVRSELLGNIVLEGGNTLFDGIKDRLEKEIHNVMLGKNLVDACLKKWNYKSNEYVNILCQDVVDMIYEYGEVDKDERIYNKLYKTKLIVQPHRKYSVWIGGAMFARNDEFKNEWITKQQYDEIGAGAIHR